MTPQHPDAPPGAPAWWSPLPKDPQYVSRGVSGRLVETLEHGWVIRVRCLACNAHSVIGYKELTVTYRRFLGADGSEFAKRLKCSCGALGPQVCHVNGHYRPTWMAGDVIEERARWIRQTLSELGVDPANLGYAPLPHDFGRK
jgi:hypothetical protein